MSGLNKVSFLYKCLQQVTACTIQKAESGKHVSIMPEETRKKETTHSTMPGIGGKTPNPPQHRRNSEKTIMEICFTDHVIFPIQRMFLPVNRE